MSSRLSLIAALDLNGVIGRDGDLPWHLPDDMRFFKRVTMGKPVIMGRKTYASIGKPLVGRQNIVITRNMDFLAPGCVVVHSISAAIEAAGDAAEIMVAGGGELYAAMLADANRMYLTLVETEIDHGDVCFPKFDDAKWREVSREYHERDARHAYPFVWLILERAIEQPSS